MITAAVEGLADEAVIQRLIEFTGGRVGTVYGKHGKAHLIRRLPAYDKAARFSPWVILLDLDTDAECAPGFRQTLPATPAPRLCLTIVVRAVEAWLMGDRDHLARFLSVSAATIPVYPETLLDPKRTLIDLASASRRRDIREDMVPRPGSHRSVGPAYTSRLIEFATLRQDAWRPDVAAPYAPSLARTIRCIRRLVSAPGIESRRGPDDTSRDQGKA